MDELELLAIVLLKDRSIAGAFVRSYQEDQTWVIVDKIAAMSFDSPYRLIHPGDDDELIEWLNKTAAEKGAALPRVVVFDSVKESMGWN